MMSKLLFCKPHVDEERKRKAELQIEDLPRELIEMILSKLPLRDAVRSSILSNKWKRAWTCHPNLIFSMDTMLGCCVQDSAWEGSKVTSSLYVSNFVKYVKSVLRLHSGIGVEEFKLEFRLSQKHVLYLDRWIIFAFKSRAKHIAVNLIASTYNYNNTYRFPLRLLSRQDGVHLKHLQLTHVLLALPPNFDCFANLTTLELQFVVMIEQDLQSFLSNCLALERLTLGKFIHVFACLRIAHQLRRLEYLCLEDFTVEKLEIYATGIKTIVYDYYVEDIEVHNRASQLREITATLEGSDTLQYIFTGFPSTLPYLERLTVNIWEDIEMSEVPRCIDKFMHLRFLNLDIVLDEGQEFDLLRLAHILEAAPCLEQFFLNCFFYIIFAMMEEDELEYSPASIPSCPHHHLTRVEFTGFIGYKDQIALAKHILIHAKALEIMVIEPRFKEEDWFYESNQSDYGREVAIACLSPEDSRNVLTVR